MGDLWRSQEMQLLSLIIQNDTAHDVISKMGELGLVDFRDLNAPQPSHTRTFVDDVRKCDEMSRLLRHIKDELDAAGVEPGLIKPVGGEPLEVLAVKVAEMNEEIMGLRETQDLLRRNHNALVEQKLVLELGEKLYSAQRGRESLAEKSAKAPQMQELMTLSEFGASSGTSSMLGVLTGMVTRENLPVLEKIVFRATRGNALFQSTMVAQPLLTVEGKGETVEVEKDFFMIFFSGDVAREKISKICGHFGATLYKYPETSEHGEMLTEVIKRIAESDEVMASGDSVLRGVLSAAAAAYPGWDYEVKKEKMVFDTLNMCEFDIKRHVFVAEGWVPKRDVDKVDAALHEVKLERGLELKPILNLLDSRLTPPTFVPTTRFTSGFQALVNTYGTPRYREANPGAFAVILFPFLFGIMFGDFGHGLLLAALGGFLIKKEKDFEGQKMNDMLAMMYGGRYIILLNGLFGAYVGMMYNEAFAFPMNWFGGSRWYQYDEQFGTDSPNFCLSDQASCQMAAFDGDTNPAGGYPTSPYPIGIDPLWHNTQNKITFFNSYKMKISIVVGVIQMSVGIILSLLNHIEYKDWKCVFFRFIPEWIFFQSIFGYLVMCIFMKWTTNWTCTNADANGDRDLQMPFNGLSPPVCQPPPSLLNMLIKMFMSPTADINEPLYAAQCSDKCSDFVSWGLCGLPTVADACAASCTAAGLGPFEGADSLHEGDAVLCESPFQTKVQNILLIAAFVAVPFLLIPIPIIELMQHNAEVAKRHEYEKLKEEGGDTEELEAELHAMGGGGGHGHGEEFSFGDAAIHQGIHTIEFVLGAISNTASYLRLWALSLAHSQLAELFKDMILVENGFLFGAPEGGIANIILTFFCFAVWLVLSFVVLMVMENLSSFLHALRLQWVEFQNKFFYGDGQKYEPFAFSSIGAESEE